MTRVNPEWGQGRGSAQAETRIAKKDARAAGAPAAPLPLVAHRRPRRTPRARVSGAPAARTMASSRAKIASAWRMYDAVVEQRVEVEPRERRGLRCEQRAQRRPRVPRLLRGPLHDPVGILARACPRVDQREHHALRGVDPTGVDNRGSRASARGRRRGPSTSFPRGRRSMKWSVGRRVGPDHAFDASCG